MPTFYAPIDLSKNELRNAAMQNLPSAPSAPAKGQIYMNTGDNTLYWWDGAQWIAAKAAAGATPAGTVTTEAVGDAPVVGVSTNFAREDHKHGREAFGAITAQTAFGAASSNGAATTVTRSDHTHGTPTHDNAAHSAINLSALAVPTANISLNGNKLTNVGTPTVATDAANMQFVMDTLAGATWKEPVDAATTGNITLSGNQTVDNVALVGGVHACLVKNQSTATQNGIYDVQTGAWTRRADSDAAAEIPGAAVFVMAGTLNGDTGWVNTNDQGFTFGTAITYVQFASPGSITAGTGMTQSGNTLNVIAGDTSLTVAADSVIVNTAVIATVASVTAAVTGVTKKYAGALTGTASPETVTHNLGTRDIASLTVLNGASPYTAVEVDWDATTINTCVIRFNPNLGTGYRVVVAA